MCLVYRETANSLKHATSLSPSAASLQHEGKLTEERRECKIVIQHIWKQDGKSANNPRNLR